MSNKTGVFRRYEKKYMLDNAKLADFLEAINPHTVADRYDHYTIRNVYFDTDNYQIIRRSIEKPVYKEKLRFRYYGEIDQGGKVFLELKKKYKKEVFKRRISMNLGELDQYLTEHVEPDGPRQILSEIEYFMAMYNPVPKIFIAYDRTALSGREDSGLRITFDENIRFRTSDLNLLAGDEGHRILDENQILMEIKAHGPMPLWLSHALNQFEIYPTSFSKYGYCYENYICRKQPVFQFNQPGRLAI